VAADVLDPLPVRSGLTHDTLFDGAIELLQPETGYRANIDALLLGAFASARPARHVVDLGCGVGTVALALAHFGAAERATLVDRDPRLLELAQRNTRTAGLASRVLERDLCAQPISRADVGSADLIVANPPFFAEATGRPRRHLDDRRARSGALAPFLRAGAALLDGPRSRFCIAYPARSLQDLLENATTLGLVAKRLRLVHARVDRPARLALLELRRARRGGLLVEPPLVEWTAPGIKSSEIESLIGRRTVDRT
jgi:tRNA1Val (adenine37-N6)-methyltransferase